jgi:hypothetical protein
MALRENCFSDTTSSTPQGFAKGRRHENAFLEMTSADSSPVITADWTASKSDRWTVPVGGGLGRVFRVGKQPLNARTEFLNNVRTTNGVSDWQMQVQLQLVFIRHK